MATDLLSIAQSGVRAARVALDLTAQNIANAGTEGYVRRSARLAEVSSTGGVGLLGPGELSLSGVRFDGVVRNADAFRQSEVRRTGSDLARAEAELGGLRGIEDALAESGLFDGLVGFDGALQQLLADPTDTALRAVALEAARTVADGFNFASRALDAVAQGATSAAGSGVEQVNALGQELARINFQLTRTAGGGNDRSALFDRRDAVLERLSQQAAVAAAFAADGTVEVRVGGPTGAVLVGGGAAATLVLTSAPGGAIGFALNGVAVQLPGGALAGQAQVLERLATARSRLDGSADALIATVNAAQANGVALDGAPGAVLFAGSGAATIAVALDDPRGLATAPVGAGAQSRDPANLAALRGALTAIDPAGQADALLGEVSAAVAGRTIARDALNTVADSARAALQAQAGVDLDQEAVNLIRFQQAFQASGRAMQTASDIFNTLLGIR